MVQKVPFVEGETYHVYNRGAHKQNVFLDKTDYWRFLMLLFLSNGANPIVMRDTLKKYRGGTSVDLFVEVFRKETPDKSLVDILAYCLMPNHFHLIVRGKAPGGITKFMGRVNTGYSMYFNTKRGHSGTLWQGSLKSKHVGSEPYFRYIFSYVHLNSLELVQPGWKEHGILDMGKARIFVRGYEFSSYPDYAVQSRPQSALLGQDVPDFLRDQDDLELLLNWLQQNPEVPPLYTEAEPL